jgi:hypothetical protein
MLAAFALTTERSKYPGLARSHGRQHIDGPIDRISFAEETTDDRRH